MILRTTDLEEICGRLRVLSKIAYLCDQCKSWDWARSAYFAILSSIEEGEATWSLSFGHYDMMCLAPIGNMPESKIEYRPAPSSKLKPQSKKEFFCRDFQRGDCSIPPPHKSWIKNSYENVEHFCGVCYRVKARKLTHVPGAEGCVNRK